MDTISKVARSALMARIRSKDSKPERALRSAMHRAGLRFRLHRTDLPGTPDIVLPATKIAIFVHGCFWHQHPRCKLASSPRSNTEYWLPKLQRNVERDRRVAKALRHLGWAVLTVWECQIRKEISLAVTLKRIHTSVRKRKDKNATQSILRRRGA
ncbi:very short patch repair endonuclease [Ralstonia pseudosolanacearum]